MGAVDTVNGQDVRVNQQKRYTETSYEVSLRQNLYSGGETTYNIKSLEEKYLAAKYDYMSKVQKFVEGVIKNYYDVVFNKEAIELNRQNFKMLSKISAIVEKNIRVVQLR